MQIQNCGSCGATLMKEVKTLGDSINPNAPGQATSMTRTEFCTYQLMANEQTVQAYCPGCGLLYAVEMVG